MPRQSFLHLHDQTSGRVLAAVNDYEEERCLHQLCERCAPEQFGATTANRVTCLQAEAIQKDYSINSTQEEIPEFQQQANSVVGEQRQRHSRTRWVSTTSGRLVVLRYRHSRSRSVERQPPHQRSYIEWQWFGSFRYITNTRGRRSHTHSRISYAIPVYEGPRLLLPE